MTEDDPRNKGHQRRGPTFEGNVAFGNGGAGFSLPAGMEGHFKNNIAFDNTGGGFVFRDDYPSLLAALQLRPDTPPDVLARAIVSIRSAGVYDETAAADSVKSAGLGGWLVAHIPSYLAFAANLLKVADSPAVHAFLARLAS